MASCFYNKTDKAITEGYYGVPVQISKEFTF